MQEAQHIEPKSQDSDEISLKDLILKVKNLWKLFLSKIKTILLISLIGGALGLVNAWMSKPVYEAKMTFVMRAESNNMLSSLSGLTSLLGAGTSAASASPMDRILELLGSDRIIGEALLSESTIEGKNDLIINHLIALEELKDKWKKDTILNVVSFSKSDQFETLSYAQRKAIKYLKGFVASEKGGILTKGFDKKSGVINIAVSYANEALSIALTNAIYNKIVDFYSKESMSNITSKLEVLQNKVDSIKNALGYTQSASAKQMDQGLGILLQQDRVQQKNLSIKENMLILMYGEAQKNLEQLSFIQATTSPTFSIIDQPYSPITPVKKSKTLYTLTWSILLGFFSFGFLLARSWFESVMKSSYELKNSGGI
jgi:uncharacterized protein involved in exopolysaccharide biosynthesis